MAAGIKFLFEFSLGMYDETNPGVNIISVTSTADGDFAPVNLTTAALRETWRSSDVDVIQRIVIEANDDDTIIDVFAILNHNLSENAVVTIEGNDTDNWVAPSLSAIPLTWSEKHLVLVQDLNTAYRYYRISILDPLNACGYIEIGRIVAGRAFTFTQNEDVTDDFTVEPADLAYQMKTEGFFRASNERVQVDRLTMKFDRLTTQSSQNANYRGLVNMTRTVGITFPFLTVLDPSDPYYSLIWGQIEALPTRQHTVNRYVSMQFTVQEVL